MDIKKAFHPFRRPASAEAPAHTTAENSIPPSSPEDAAAAIDPATPEAQLTTLAQNRHLAPLVAANPAAPSSLLDHLARSGDPAARRAVAGNPNTPTATLFDLAAEYPVEFFANPAFTLLSLERPTFAHQMKTGILDVVVAHPAAPRSFLASLITYHDRRIADAARLHINIGGDIQETWEHAADEALCRIPLYPVLPEDLFALLRLDTIPDPFVFSLVVQGNDQLRRAIARCKGLPRSVLDPFFRAGASPVLCGYVPPDPTLDPAVLAGLAEKGRWASSLAARHPATPPSILSRLATSDSSEIRGFVARNPTTPRDTLARLSDDQHDAVRTLVARNREVPQDLLAHLAVDSSWSVRRFVAAHPRVPLPILEKLADDPDQSVRYAAARHPGLPSRLLDHLATSDDPVIRHLVACHPLRQNRPSVQVRAVERGQRSPLPTRRTQRATAVSPHRTSGKTARDTHVQQVLETLTERRYDVLLEGIAVAHPAARTEWLYERSSSREWVHRFAVAYNPTAPPELLATLATDTNSIVRAAARARIVRRGEGAPS